MMTVTGPVKLGFTPGDTVVVTGAGSGIGRLPSADTVPHGLTPARFSLEGVAQ